MKKTDLFDKLMREKLNDIQPGMKPGHWDLLNEQLEQGALEDEIGYSVPDSKPVDEAIFEKLHQYKAPYNPGHWDKMAALLDDVFAWPTQIIRYKATELTLMLLLFLFLWQFAARNTGSAYQQSPIAGNSFEERKQAGADKDEASLMPQADESNEEIRNLATENRPGLNASTSNGQNLTSSGNTVSPNIQETEFSKDTPSGQMDDMGNGVAGKREKINISTLPGRAIEEIPYSSAQLSERAYLLANSAKNIERKELNVLAQVEKLSPGLLDETEKALPDEVLPDPIKRKGVLRLGMFGSGEYNHIIVQSSNEKSKSEQVDRFSIGYGSGLSIGLDMGRWELETGAIYAAREFPVGVIYIDGSITDGLFANELKAAELNIINFPLHFRYNFILKREWRVYALAGGALQMAFQANYFTVSSPELTYQPVNPAMPQPTPGRGQEPSVIRIKEESVGLLEGGAFNDNAYITGNIGFGVERYINDSWSLYVQPTYQHSLHYFREGLGPNRDRLNSLSILMGAKVHLW